MKLTKKHWVLGAWYGLVIVFLVFSLYIHFHIDNLLDSDMSGELVLAKILADSKSLLSTDWYYTTEIRLLYLQIVFIPLFWLFNNWHLVRVLGTIICWLLFLASLYYLCRQINLPHVFPILGMVFLCPLSWTYFAIVVFGIFYLPHLTIISLVLAAILNITKTANKKKIIVIGIILVIVAILSGMNGYRLMLILYIPLLVAAVLTILLALHRRQKQRTAIPDNILRFSVTAVITFGCAFLGFVINCKVLDQYFYFGHYGDAQFSQFSLGKVVTIFKGFLQAFGYNDGDVFNIGQLVTNLLSFLLLMLTIISSISIVRQSSKYQFEQRIYVWVGILAIALFVTWYLIANNYPPFQERFCFPLLIYVFPIIAIYLLSLPVKLWITDKFNKITKGVLIGSLLLIYSFVGLKIYQDGLKPTRNVEFSAIVKVLQTQECYQGYATFWQGNILTELSGGAVEVWTWFENNQDVDLTTIDQIHPYSQKISHGVTRPTGKIFILFTTAECNQLTLATQIQNLPDFTPYLWFHSENYTLYGFESYEALQNLLLL